MRPSRIVLALAVVASLAVSATTALGSVLVETPVDTGEHRVGRQRWFVFGEGALPALTGTGWQATRVGGIPVLARGGMTATVSGEFAGAPVQLKLTYANGPGGRARRLGPGVAAFDPSRGATSFSYTWPEELGDEQRCRYVKLWWRSPTGEEVRVRDHLSVVVTYQGPAHDPDVCPT